MLYPVFHMPGLHHRGFGVFALPRGGLFLMFFHFHPLLGIVCAKKQKTRKKQTVIANQCAHWCGNLLLSMGIPTGINALGMTVYLYIISSKHFRRAFQIQTGDGAVLALDRDLQCTTGILGDQMATGKLPLQP